MSISANIYGGLESSDPIALTSIDATSIFTATNKDTIVATLSIANEGTAPAKVTLYRKSGDDSFTIWHQVMAANSTSVITDIPMRLYTGEAITAMADTADVITITPIVLRVGSYEAHTRSNR